MPCGNSHENINFLVRYFLLNLNRIVIVECAQCGWSWCGWFAELAQRFHEQEGGQEKEEESCLQSCCWNWRCRGGACRRSVEPSPQLVAYTSRWSDLGDQSLFMLRAEKSCFWTGRRFLSMNFFAKKLRSLHDSESCRFCVRIFTQWTWWYLIISIDIQGFVWRVFIWFTSRHALSWNSWTIINKRIWTKDTSIPALLTLNICIE